MREIAGIFLTLFSIFSYFVLATYYAVYQRVPLPHLLGCLIACVFLGFTVASQKGWRRFTAVAALVLCLGLTGLYAWYTLVYSTYEGDASPATGTSFAAELQGLTLPSPSGEPTEILHPGDRGTLLVFYRGFW